MQPIGTPIWRLNISCAMITYRKKARGLKEDARSDLNGGDAEYNTPFLHEKIGRRKKKRRRNLMRNNLNHRHMRMRLKTTMALETNSI